ncbi:DUF7553 family protein [Halospeciosus flavus]|uniref:Uncharacterized protein n=1 Tax=Halospeciosus flavus TaxID=3032283 RepID=A0ABD5Z9H5_9EURY|nr:hypothetical protein [Halospeciosus flavus]
MTGKEEEPEPSRLEKLQEEIEELEEKVEGETKEALQKARERLGDYRAKEEGQ